MLIDIAPRKCLAAMECFMAVQRDHLAGIKTGPGNDFNSWRCQRQEVFDNLRNILAGLQYENVAEEVKNKILLKFKELVGLEQQLELAARKQKDNLALGLAAMRKGRKALNGYGSKGKSGMNPRFLSSRL